MRRRYGEFAVSIVLMMGLCGIPFLSKARGAVRTEDDVAIAAAASTEASQSTEASTIVAASTSSASEPTGESSVAAVPESDESSTNSSTTDEYGATGTSSTTSTTSATTTSTTSTTTNTSGATTTTTTTTTTTPSTPPPTFVVPEFDNPILILGGADRYATMYKEAMASFPDGVEGAVVVSGENWPDALSASGLAGALGYAILLTPTNSLSTYTSQALADLGVKHAVIIGGTSAVSAGVAAKISKTGVDVVRIGGANRTETSELVFEYGKSKQVWRTSDAVVSTDSGFADAASISPMCYERGVPILLTQDNHRLSQRGYALVSDKLITRVIAVGGTDAVDDDLEAKVSAKKGVGSTVRLAGNDRYATSLAIARWTKNQGYLSWDGIAFASGDNYPDALCGSVLQGITKAPLLLVNSSSAAIDAIASCSSKASNVSHIRFFGGLSATPAVARRAAIYGFGIPKYDLVDRYIAKDSEDGSVGYYLASKGATLYSHPDVDSAEAGNISEGTCFAAYAYDAGGGWLCVYQNGLDNPPYYLPGIYADPVVLPANDAWNTFNYHGFSAKALAVYQIPYEQSPTYGTISSNTYIAYRHYDAAGKWLIVDYGGKTGYIRNTNDAFTWSKSLRNRLESIIWSRTNSSMNDNGRLWSIFSYLALEGRFRYISHDTPNWSGWEADYTTWFFNDGGGNCQSFAATYCLLCQSMGIYSSAILGRVGAAGGGTLPHGWTEVYIGGQTLVCDPEGAFETGSSDGMFLVNYDNSRWYYYK